MGKSSSQRIVWEPNSRPQALFLSCPYPELLFGGARGPGKTDSLLMGFAQFVGTGLGADWKGIIFRQTYKQLEEIIAKTQAFFPRMFKGARFSRGRMEWIFPAGETLKLRHARRPADMENYQGHEYPYVGFDELCNLSSQEVYEKAKGFCRSSNPKAPKLIRCTANPLGPGYLWVKRYFIDPAPPLTPIMNEHGGKRVFIPATIYDNRHLVEADPDYLRRLESISDDSLRRAWLDGDWNVVAGSFFGDVWMPDRNVIRPFAIPSGWYCFRSFDWGSARPFSVGWWAVADGTQAPDGKFYPRGAMIRFSEWYGAKKNAAGMVMPNEGLRMSSREVARGILEREKVMRARWGIAIAPGPADPAIYASADGPSVADNMAREGVVWKRADNSRLTGWQQVREKIWGEEDKPFLYVFNTCTELLRTLPAAPHDERIPDDIDTDFEDHCLTGDTLVWTAEGLFPIQEIVGREGRVFGGDGKLHRFSNARLTRKGAEIVRVTFEDGTSVVCTKDHRILTSQGYVESSRLLDETGYATFLLGGQQYLGQSVSTRSKHAQSDVRTLAKAERKVISVKPAGVADVFCLDVEDVHCFAVNGGVIVHNCLDETRYACMFRRHSASISRVSTARTVY